MELESKQRELPPEGTHTAICYLLVDFGTQKKANRFKNNIEETNKWFQIGWELSDELMSDGRPFAISRDYKNNNFSKSTIMKDLTAWFGKLPEGFKLEQALAKPCNITIAHNPSQDGSRMYANITAITPLKKGEKAPAMVNKIVYFDLGAFDQSVFDALPEWMREKIKLSPEYHEAIKNPVDTSPPFEASEIPDIKGAKYVGA